MKKLEFPREKELCDLQTKVAKLQKEWYEFDLVSRQVEDFKIDPDAVILAYIERLKPFCYQGGTGHAFYYQFGSLTAPHHWVVRPEHYEMAKPSKDEQLALRFKRFYPAFYFSIKKQSATEQWGN